MIRVACAQYAIRDADPDNNLDRALHFIRQAAAEGADLIVLPELATPAATSLYAIGPWISPRTSPAARSSKRGRKDRNNPASTSSAGCWRGEMPPGPPSLLDPRRSVATARRTSGTGEAPVRAGRRAAGLRNAAGEDRASRLLRRLVPRGARTLAVKGAHPLYPVQRPRRLGPGSRAGETSRCSTSTASPPPTPTASSSPPPTASATATWDAAASWTSQAASSLAGATEEGVIGAEVDPGQGPRRETANGPLPRLRGPQPGGLRTSGPLTGALSTSSISSSTSSSIAAAEVALKIRTLPRSG